MKKYEVGLSKEPNSKAALQQINPLFIYENSNSFYNHMLIT